MSHLLGKERKPISIAILDLYMGYPNQGMQAFCEIIKRYNSKNSINLTCEIFDVRNKKEFPGTSFDIYLSSGGPGSPLENMDADWGDQYFRLFDELQEINYSDSSQKKHAFFICHSFQLMCRRYQLGRITERASAAFGVFEIHPTEEGLLEPVFNGLNDPFYAIDSRNWQVIQPDLAQFEQMGATVLAIEKHRPHVDKERCLMAIRFSKYFLGTQFHPEANPSGLKLHLLTDEKKQQVIADHGMEKYEHMLQSLDHPEKILLTQNTIIPNFLDQAIFALQEA
ncbi:MAG: type 1 glutamine amidotransferase [Sphingobacteriaceae bacterium]